MQKSKIYLRQRVNTKEEKRISCLFLIPAIFPLVSVRVLFFFLTEITVASLAYFRNRGLGLAGTK